MAQVKHGIRLQCSNCNQINYLTKKNAKNVTEKLELNKYCNNCHSTQIHKEIKAKK